MRDGRRSKQVMSVELAMQREMAYREKLESSQGNETMEDSPLVRKSGMSVPESGCGPRSTTTASTRPTSSTWLKQSQKPPNPSSVPLKEGSDPRPLQTRAPCLSPKNNNVPPPNRNVGPRFVAKSGSQSGSCQARQKPEPILGQRSKAVVVLPKPNLNQPQGPGIPPRPVPVPIPSPYSKPRLQTGPNFTANPFSTPGQDPNSGPSQKRKEAPNQQFQPVKGVKMSKLYCGLCKVTCSSPGNLEDHLKGQKHQSKKKMGEFGTRMGMNDPQLLFCELCGVWCMNEFCYHQHLNGKSHILKLHTAQK